MDSRGHFPLEDIGNLPKNVVRIQGGYRAQLTVSKKDVIYSKVYPSISEALQRVPLLEMCRNSLLRRGVPGSEYRDKIKHICRLMPEDEKMIDFILFPSSGSDRASSDVVSLCEDVDETASSLAPPSSDISQLFQAHMQQNSMFNIGSNHPYIPSGPTNPIALAISLLNQVKQIHTANNWDHNAELTMYMDLLSTVLLYISTTGCPTKLNGNSDLSGLSGAEWERRAIVKRARDVIYQSRENENSDEHLGMVKKENRTSEFVQNQVPTSIFTELAELANRNR